MDWLPTEVSSAPATEPVTVAEVKSWLRIDSSDDDTLLGTLITAARQQVEAECGLALITQTLKFRASALCGSSLHLPRAPVSAITSITYTDTDGVVQTLDTAGYRAVLQGVSPLVELAYGEAWPSQREQAGGVVITATAGYGAASAVPAPIKHAITIAVGAWHQDRAPGADLPAAARALLANYRTFVL